MPSTVTDRLNGLTTSVAVKAPCHVATTAAILLFGLQTIDGVVLQTGDRVLVKNQTNPIENGIWLAATSTWYRAADFDGSLDVVGGTNLKSNLGAVNQGAYWQVDGDGSLLPGSDPIPISRTTENLSVPSGSAGVGFLQSGTGAVPLTVEDELGDTVSVKQFGAMCDGTTDDTVAVQKAIDHCLTFSRPLALRVPGRCRLTAALKIDKAVDTSLSEFHIYGEGSGAGFYTTTNALTFFDTNIAATTDPVSEGVVFRNIHFEASSGALNTLAMSWKFLRVKFMLCTFEKVRIVNSPIYLQSWKFVQCRAYRWPNAWFQTVGVIYDCHWLQCEWEKGEDGILSTSNGLNGSSIVSCVFEGSRRFFKQAGGQGFSIIGNYTEINSEIDYTFTDIGGGGVARGFTFTGNHMTTAHGLANVSLGDVQGATTGGNYCNDKLYSLSSTRMARLQSNGDFAGGAKFSDASRAMEVRPEGINGLANTITAHAGGGLVAATKLTASVNIVTTVATALDSVGLPPTDSMSDGNITRTILVVNAGANTLRVWSGADDFTNFGTNLSWDIPPGSARSFVQSFQGVMRSISPVATAQADSVAAAVADLKTDFNALLAKLRTAGLMVP